MNRRQFLGGVVVAGAIAIAGCANDTAEERVSNRCRSGCENIEDIGVDSHSGLGSYTNVVVEFSEPFTGEITVRTYGSSGEINGARTIEVENQTVVEVEWDDYKTDTKVAVETHPK